MYEKPPTKENAMAVARNFGKCCGEKMVARTTSSTFLISPLVKAFVVPWIVDMNLTALEIPIMNRK
jgi:hypothetical protein